MKSNPDSAGQEYWRDAVAWPDERLGMELFAARLAAEAAAIGLPLASVPEGLVDRWIERMAVQGTDTVPLHSIEKALQAAARGDAATAGRTYRAYLLHRETRVAEQHGAARAAAHLSSLKSNGSKGAAARRKFSEQDHTQWQALASNPEWEMHSKRRRAELIAQKLGLPESAIETIRKAI